MSITLARLINIQKSTSMRKRTISIGERNSDKKKNGKKTISRPRRA